MRQVCIIKTRRKDYLSLFILIFMHARRRRRSTMQRRSPPPRVIPSLAMPPRLHPSVVVVVVKVFVVVTPSPAGGTPDPFLASDRPSGRETKARSTSVDVGRRRRRQRRRPLVVVPPPRHRRYSSRRRRCPPRCWRGSTRRPPNVDAVSVVVSHDVAPPPIVAFRVRHIVPPPPSYPPRAARPILVRTSHVPLIRPIFVVRRVRVRRQLIVESRHRDLLCTADGLALCEARTLCQHEILGEHRLRDLIAPGHLIMKSTTAAMRLSTRLPLPDILAKTFPQRESKICR